MERPFNIRPWKPPQLSGLCREQQRGQQNPGGGGRDPFGSKLLAVTVGLSR